MNDLESTLDRLAVDVASRLKAANVKCVFAESCTGGKMAAALTRVPGISEYFCGSAVTYRESTKTQWLGISQEDLQTHTAESRFTTTAMAMSVLNKTPEASISVAITGHLGPGVDASIDGIIFVAIASRQSEQATETCTEHRLKQSTRSRRQTEAARIALEQFLEVLDSENL